MASLRVDVNSEIPQVKEEEDLHEQDKEKLRTAYQQMLAQVWKSHCQHGKAPSITQSSEYF